MSPELANFLFEVVNFLLLAAALAYFFFKPVRAALSAELERRASERTELDAAREEAERLVGEARRERERLSAELERRRATMLAEAQREADAIKQAARSAQSAQRRRLRNDLAAERRVQLEQMVDDLGRVAAASVRLLLDSLSGPSLDLSLVRGACRELGPIAGAARGRALVESAHPLDEASRELLTAALAGPFEQRVVPALGAGVRVTTSAGQVDGSALAVARLAARQTAREAREALAAAGEEP